MPELPNPKSRTPSDDAPALVYAPEPYAELDVATNFSFLRGASHPDELVFRAAELGYRAIAVTDRNSLAGVVRAHEAAKKAGLKLLIGARLTFADAPDALVWCADRPAYARLCRLLTTGKRRADKGSCALWFADLLGALADAPGLLAAIVPPEPIDPHVEQVLARLRDVAGDPNQDRLSIATSCLYHGTESSRLRDLVGLSRAFELPLLATNGVHYHVPDRRRLQDVLTCIRHGCTIHDAGFRLFPNGERYLKSPAQMYHVFKTLPEALARTVQIAERCTFSLDELKYEYPDELVPPGKTLSQYLRELAEDGARQRYPDGVPPKVRQQIEHELKLIAQLRYEAYFLTVYDLMKFARSRGILCQGRGSAANSAVCYCIGVTSVDPNRIDVLFERFVSAARKEPPDIDVDFEHERREEVLQYLYQKYGRQRAGMTAEVISYRGRSAVRDVGKVMGLSLDLVDQMAKRLDGWNAGTISEKQLRELGLDPTDRTVRLVVELTGQLLGFPRHLSQHVGGMIMTRSPLCEMVPVENASMADRTVIEWDKDDIDAVGILKVDVLALGMLTCISKAFRLIEQSGCGAGFPACTNRECRLESLRHNTPPRLDLHTIPPEDPAVYDMICHADTIGVFQIESRAQMSMLPRLQPRCFYDLVIEVAIVRPGPIQGNMVHPYLRRRRGEEEVTFPSEALRDVLQKTLGVPLFQEQAMKLAIVAAGFTADEADQLRRSMAAWRKTAALEKFRPKLINGMLANGYERPFAEQCFEQIRGFGEYGFPESHAASFALLVYVSSWLKRYHPAAFATALINSQPMGFYAPAQIVRDAQEHGVTVRAVDVNESEWDCTLEEGSRGVVASATMEMPEDTEDMVAKATMPLPPPSTWGIAGPVLRLGLRIVKGLRAAHVEQLLAERRQRGRFTSIRDLRLRTGLPKPTLQRLAEADAFGSMGLSRREALWQVLGLEEEAAPLFDQLEGKGHEGTEARRHEGEDKGQPQRHRDTEAKLASAPLCLCGTSSSQYQKGADSSPPCLHASVPSCLPPSGLPPMPRGQEVMTDYATAGLSLKDHPVALVRAELNARKVITAAQFKQTPAGKWVRVAGLVLIRQRPGTASGVVFETLEDETGIVNLIVRPHIYDQYQQAARFGTLIEAQGIVERQGEVIHVMVKTMEDLTHLVEGLRSRSRDFH